MAYDDTLTSEFKGQLTFQPWQDWALFGWKAPRSSLEEVHQWLFEKEELRICLL